MEKETELMHPEIPYHNDEASDWASKFCVSTGFKDLDKAIIWFEAALKNKNSYDLGFTTGYDEGYTDAYERVFEE